MNKEFRKLNELSSDPYTPPATSPGYSRNTSDVLLPQSHHDVDSLEEDVADIVGETKTPPETPSDMEKGKAECRLFRDVKHYVDPVYQEAEYRRLFTTKLIIANMLTYTPIMLLMIIICSWGDLDYNLIQEPTTFFFVCFVSMVARAVSIYYMGLFRTRYLLYIALTVRVILNTLIFCSIMIIIHTLYLRNTAHPEDRAAEFNQTYSDDKDDFKVVEIHAVKRDHAPPYMAILVISLMWTVEGIVCVLVFKLKCAIDDYRIPFVVYTTCFSTSALLVTVVLNDGFGYLPLGYDVFQVITGCYISSLILMRTPEYVIRLYEGKVCPLKEDELLYALIHWGL